MVRKVTIARFEEWRAKPENVEAFFRLMEGREGKKPLRFRDACFELKVPYTLMHGFIHADDGLKRRYERLLEALADQLAHERLEIADKVKPDRDEVAKAKLQCEVRESLESKWYRERYGDKIQIEKNVNVSVDAGLLGTAADLLRMASTAQPRVIESEDTLTLPAPKDDGQA